MKKLAIIGLGDIYERTKNVLDNLEDMKVLAVCDLSKEKLAKFKNLDILCTDNYKDIISLVDYVLINTPPDTHYNIAKDFMEYGANVIIEKPLVSNLYELERLVKLSQSYNVNIYSLLHYSFGKELFWFKDNIKRKDMPIRVTAIIAEPRLETGKLDEHSIALGGAYMDSTINALSAVMCLFDGEVQQTSLQRRFDKYTGLDIWANSTYEITIGENKIPVDITISWDCPKEGSSISLYYPDDVYILDTKKQVVKSVVQGKVLFKGDGVRVENRYKAMYKDLQKNKTNIDFSYKLHNAIFQGLQNENEKEYKSDLEY